MLSPLDAKKHSQTRFKPALIATDQVLGLDLTALLPEEQNVRFPASALPDYLQKTLQSVNATEFSLGADHVGSGVTSGYTILPLFDVTGGRGAVALFFEVDTLGVVTRSIVFTNDYTGNPATTRWQQMGGGASAPKFSPYRNWLQDSLTRFEYMGGSEFFTARQDLLRENFPGGEIPAPTGEESDPYWQLESYGGGDEGATFTITPTETIGGVQAGVTYTGNSEDLLRTMLVRYQVPSFTLFQVAGASSRTVEVGTPFAAGFKSFTWSTSNAANVAANSISIQDVTAGTTLATAEANDGTASASTVAFTVTEGISRRYRISGVNSKGAAFSSDLTYTGRYMMFFGPSATPVTTSAQARLLPGNQLTSAGNQFTLNTGNTATIFNILLPPGRTLVSVVDLDALNKDITAEYLTGSLSVNDAGGSPVGYTSRVKTQAIPYDTNHRHLVTTS